MQTDKKSSIPRLFIVVSVVFGLLLAAFSIASGSNPLIQPDYASIEKELQNNPVQVEQLAGWMVEGRRDFRVAGFRSPEACSEQKALTRKFKCYDSNQIKDSFWIRKTFRNVHMPLIVFGSETADGLAAAVQLKHMGYDVRYLEEGFNGFAENYLQPDEDSELDATGVFFAGNDPLVKTKGARWVIASADGMLEEEDEEVELGDDEEDYEEEEEEEEEEEGC